MADLRPRKRGSLEEGFLALGALLRDAGVPVTLILSQPAGGALAAAYREAGLALDHVDFRRPVAALVGLGRRLWAARPAVVHFHFVRAHAPLVWLARAVGAEVVIHDHLALRPGRGLRAAVKRLRGRLSPQPLRVAPSEAVARSVERAEAAERVRVVENGVPLGRFVAGRDGRRAARRALGLPLDRPIVGCVSRLADEKGVDVAVRALAGLSQRPILVVAGEGPDRAALEALAASRGVELRLLGLRQDAEQVLIAADVVVVPSRAAEAFGLAAAEAMAAARPVVVSDRGALPEVVGDAGVVVPAEDPEALGRAVARLLDDPTEAARLGRAARRRARARFDVARWARSLVALYHELVERRA